MSSCSNTHTGSRTRNRNDERQTPSPMAFLGKSRDFPLPLFSRSSISFSLLPRPTSLPAANLHVLPPDGSAQLVLALGLTFVITAGEIDLSFPR